MNLLKKTLSKTRNFIFQNYREEVLSNIICKEVEKIVAINNKKRIKILDYGSGYNPILIKKIVRKLHSKYKKTKFSTYCYDYYNKKQLKKMNNNKNIKFLKIKKLNGKNLSKFNFCLLIDVLHHIGLENKNEIYRTIKILKKKSKYLIIKDHFQYGLISNLALILMDFVGNYGDSVKIPKKYFSIKSFKTFLLKSKLKEINRINTVKYYKWYWIYFNNSKLQFISILK